MAEIAMVEALRRHAERCPDLPAVTIDGLTVTFGELDERTEVIGHALAGLGVAAGDRVTIALPNSHDFVAAAFAVLKLGAAVQPVASRLPRVERHNIVELADSKLVIGADPPDHPGRRCIATLSELARPHPGPLERLPLLISERWKATTSGGATGQPKLIIGTAPAVIDDAAPEYLLPRSSVVLIPGPLYHTAPFAISLIAVAHGNHLLLERKFDAETTVRLISRHRPTYTLLVPTMMHRIWRLPEDVRDVDMSSLQTVFHMAAHCPAWLKRKWIEWLGPDRIFELYGASDSSTNTVIGGREWLAHPGSVGRVRNTERPGQGEIIVTDDDGNSLPAGEVGEIWMRPPPDSPVRATVIGAPARVRDGWSSVGDLGWIDDDGYLYISDRRKDLIVTGGENVYPAEVEGALEAHPDVRSCVVIGLPDDDLGQRVHALVEVRAGVTEADLIEHMAGQLARYKIPRSYELVDHPLRDDAGKVRRSGLVQARITDGGAKPASEAATEVAEVVS